MLKRKKTLWNPKNVASTRLQKQHLTPVSNITSFPVQKTGRIQRLTENKSEVLQFLESKQLPLETDQPQLHQNIIKNQ